jgi:hypothetical protein
MDRFCASEFHGFTRGMFFAGFPSVTRRRSIDSGRLWASFYVPGLTIGATDISVAPRRAARRRTGEHS